MLALFAQTGGFSGPDVAWFSLAPLLILVGTSLGLLVVGALTPTWPRHLYAGVTIAGAIAAGVFALIEWGRITDDGPATLVAGALAFDTFAQLVTVAVCAALIGVAAATSDRLAPGEEPAPELYALQLVAGAGAIVMGSANDLIVLFLGLETMSLAFYVLAASDRRRHGSQESGLKYFVLGGFSSAFFLYGAALVYGAVGSLNLGEIAATFRDVVPVEQSDGLILAGIALLMVGFAFKVAAVPFHVWTPDVYEGAPTPTTSLLASVGKIAAFGALVRVLVVGFGVYREDWQPIVWMLALLSVVVGSVLAVVQRNVKRMLAYSSIAHAGFILVGLEAAAHHAGESPELLGRGIPSVAFYLVTYGILVTGTFAVVALVGRHDEATDLSDFSGLAKRHPALALALTVFLVAQAGVPFTTGFDAKFGVIRAAVEERSYALAIVAMVSAVIAAFLYLRIMVSVWMEDDADAGTAVRPIPLLSGLFIAAAAVFTVAVGVAPEWLLDAVDTTVRFGR